MFTKRNLSVAALALAIAAPLTAQNDVSVLAEEARRTTAAAQRRAEIEAVREAARARARARVEGVPTTDSRIEAARRGSAASSRIPRGHLPPRGTCRVWIEGVPPGRQPAVTSCAQAERDRLTYGTNARVIYGDSESFPGRGKGKFKDRSTRPEHAIDQHDVTDRREEASAARAEKLERKASRKSGKGGKGRG